MKMSGSYRHVTEPGFVLCLTKICFWYLFSVAEFLKFSFEELLRILLNNIIKEIKFELNKIRN